MRDLATSGDVATWIGAIGTWAVGLIAAFIAWIQYNHNRFRPKVLAYWESPRRIIIRVINRGAGTGNIEHIELQRVGDSDAKVKYFCEITEKTTDITDRVPIPFPLPGESTAQLALLPLPKDSTFPSGMRVLVTKGGGKKIDALVEEALGSLFPGATKIPGESFDSRTTE